MFLAPDRESLDSFQHASRSSYAAGHVKKDGTPDMRYAVNKLSQVTLLGGQATVLDNLQEEVSLDQVPLVD